MQEEELSNYARTSLLHCFKHVHELSNYASTSPVFQARISWTMKTV